MSIHSFATGFLTFVVILASPAATHAQSWTLDAYAGRAVHDAVAADAGTHNGVLGLRYSGFGGDWFYLSAAAPLAAGDPVWGAAGLGRRITADGAGFTYGIDLGGHGHGYRDPTLSLVGAGATLEALPFLSLKAGNARLELHSGVRQYASTFSGESQARTLHDSGGRLIVRPDAALELAAEARYARAEEASYPYAGGSAALQSGVLEVWASLGRWFSDASPDPAWSSGASFRLNPRFDLWTSVRQEAIDPLYWNGSRRSWNVGMSRRLGSIAGAGRTLRPEHSVGHVTIRIPLSEARSAPVIAGDFTAWKPVAMVRSDGYWVVTLPVAPGVYHYAFRRADGRWFVPASIEGRRNDGFGGHVAVLVVQ
jgi:hypothetical protein